MMVKIHVDLKIRKEIITRTRNMFMDHWMSERESTRVLDLSLSPNTKKCMKSSLSLEQATCSLEGRANCAAKAGGGARGAPINVALGPARPTHYTTSEASTAWVAFGATLQRLGLRPP